MRDGGELLVSYKKKGESEGEGGGREYSNEGKETGVCVPSPFVAI